MGYLAVFEDLDILQKNLIESFNVDMTLYSQYNLPRNDE